MLSLTPLADIADYQADAVSAMRVFYSNSHPGYLTRFTGYLPSEVSRELADRVKETEMRSALVVLARVEAAFRRDYKTRATSKGADNLSVAFRKIYQTKKEAARFDDDILESWKRHLPPDQGALVSQLRTMLKFRHWMAHGRHWNPGTHHSFDDAYFLAEAVLSNFGLKS